MLRHVTLAMACCTLLAGTASARQVLMRCEVVDDHSGEMMHRMVAIDTERRVVRDNELTWTDGATSPLASNLVEFVQDHGNVTSWGNRKKQGGTDAGTFALDLRTGDYTFASRIRGRLSHGACKPDDSV